MWKKCDYLRENSFLLSEMTNIKVERGGEKTKQRTKGRRRDVRRNLPSLISHFKDGT